jgi:NhaP-type Na+/H+ or K+/H+ antiporter
MSLIYLTTSQPSLIDSLYSMLGFVFPLFGAQMYEALGVGWGNTLLAGLAIVIGIPFPIWIWYKGEEIRSRNPLNR